MRDSVAHETLNTRETVSLIGSDKVEGTYVYGTDGTQIGSIERVMLDKHTGKVAYAVMSFGGFLGIGADYYPLPWAKLDYNETLDGYQVDVTEQQLKGAPKYARDDEYDWTDREADRRVSSYYGVPPYWM
jgi:hypothetical protein